MTILSTDPRIAFFDHHAPHWDSYGPPLPAVLARLEELKQRLGLQPGLDVLEVGCGTGQVTAWLADAVRPGSVTAVDFSPEMLMRAKARGTDAQFICLDVCGDDLGSGRYDVAFCMHVFPHLQKKEEALRRLATALKPGGRLIVLHLMGRKQVNAIHHDAGGVVAEDQLPCMYYWPAEMEKAGLDLVDWADQDDLFLLTATVRASK
jgi:SAM-dependent methyltransferase